MARNADDPKKFWKTINNLLKGPKKETVAHEFVGNTTGETIKQGNICDFLNDYYVNVGINNIVHVNPRPRWKPYDAGYHFNPFTLKEVVDLVKEIDVYKDSCVEGVTTYILKEGFTILARQLQYLFNTSLGECEFPREWAKGYINILPKGGNLKDPSNWRPITQTLLPSKRLEKLVQRRLFKILRDSEAISKFQYGFMPGQSTQLAVFDILKDIFETKNS